MKHALILPLLFCAIGVSAQESKSKLLTFKGKEEPLFVVDGKVRPRLKTVVDSDTVMTVDSIKAEDILSVEIFKDLKATELYGEKGKNGVVVITTKAFAKSKEH